MKITSDMKKDWGGPLIFVIGFIFMALAFNLHTSWFAIPGAVGLAVGFGMTGYFFETRHFPKVKAWFNRDGLK